MTPEELAELKRLAEAYEEANSGANPGELFRAQRDFQWAANPPAILRLLAHVEAQSDSIAQRDRKIKGWEATYPCDGGCAAEGCPMEDCSRHGRRPAEVWEQWSAERDRADALQARIDRALAYVDDPGNWSAYDKRQSVLRDRLSEPSKGEEK